MQIVYSLLGSFVIALIVSGYFYFSANKTAGQLATIIIKEITGQNVKPNFNWYGKLTGVKRVEATNEKVKIGENIVKIIKPEK